MKNRTILITGVAGFIGHHLMKHLSSLGAKIIGLDNINDYYDTSLKYNRLEENGFKKGKIKEKELIQNKFSDNLFFIQSDLNDRERLSNIFTQFEIDTVIHLAAQAGVRYSIYNPEVYVHSNISGFVNLLEVCKKFETKNFIYASSSSVYGNRDEVPFVETDRTDYPVSFYAASKKCNEVIAHSYSSLYGIKTVGLRFFTVYGPWGRPDMAPALFSDNILKNKPIKVFNHGKMFRDFTYIDDIIDGISKITEKIHKIKSNYELFNIGASTPIQLMDFIETLEAIIGKEAKKNFIEMQLGDVKKTYSDISRLKKFFNYEPKTSLQTGLSIYIKWYKTYYNL